MIKKIALSLLFCALSLNINGMFKQYNHIGAKKQKRLPCCISDDATTSVKRKILEITAAESISSNALQQKKVSFLLENLIAAKDLYATRKPTEQEKGYECTRYALSRVLGFKKNTTTLLESQPIVTLNLFKYFKQTNTPQKNDFVVYAQEPNASCTTHIAIFIEKDECESKFGNSDIIARHKKSMVPISYGDYMGFFTLKNRFSTVPSTMLLNLMEYDAQINFYRLSRKFNKTLLKYYDLIAKTDALTAQHLVSLPLSTEELLGAKFEIR